MAVVMFFVFILCFTLIFVSTVGVVRFRSPNRPWPRRKWSLRWATKLTILTAAGRKAWRWSLEAFLEDDGGHVLPMLKAKPFFPLWIRPINRDWFKAFKVKGLYLKSAKHRHCLPQHFNTQRSRPDFWVAASQGYDPQESHTGLRKFWVCLKMFTGDFCILLSSFPIWRLEKHSHDNHIETVFFLFLFFFQVTQPPRNCFFCSKTRHFPPHRDQRCSMLHAEGPDLHDAGPDKMVLSPNRSIINTCQQSDTKCSLWVLTCFNIFSPKTHIKMCFGPCFGRCGKPYLPIDRASVLLKDILYYI